MAVTYRRWDADDRVSAQWFTVLSAARKAGVAFFVTDGHRTMAEQQDRWSAFQHGGPVAAFPSPTAPHIRSGRPDHAIDVNSLDGGAGRLFALAARKRGAQATFPVPGEPWHIEVPRDDLVRLAKQARGPARRLPREGAPAGSAPTTRSCASKREGDDPADGPERRSELRRLMTQPPQGDLASRKAVRAGAACGAAPATARCSPEPTTTTKEPLTMFDFLKGRRPDITAAQIAAGLVAGVPGVATLLTTFGVADVNAAQQDALSGAVTWSAVLAAVLIGGDATLRAARNLADAKTDAAAMAVGETSPLAPRVRPAGPRGRLRGGRRAAARLRRGGVLRRERARPARGGPDRREPRLREGRAMNTAAAGIALIKEFEGFPFGGRPYRDPVGVWTIGYGHTEGVGPHSPRLTEREASELLERDLGQLYEPHVERAADRERSSTRTSSTRSCRSSTTSGRGRSPPTRGSDGRCGRSSGTAPPTRCCAGTRPAASVLPG